jgi:hypothetical protein
VWPISDCSQPKEAEGSPFAFADPAKGMSKGKEIEVKKVK